MPTPRLFGLFAGHQFCLVGSLRNRAEFQQNEFKGYGATGRVVKNGHSPLTWGISHPSTSDVMYGRIWCWNVLSVLVFYRKFVKCALWSTLCLYRLVYWPICCYWKSLMLTNDCKQTQYWTVTTVKRRKQVEQRARAKARDHVKPAGRAPAL